MPYSHPIYYDVAFGSHRYTEVRFLVHCFQAYSHIPVRQIVDIACGTGPHALRLAKQGYRVTGLDLSRENVSYVAGKAQRQGLDVEVAVQDMVNFRLPTRVDAAICLQNSQSYILTNWDILRHFRAVARTLRRGGIYIFDRYIPSSWTNPARRWCWTKRRGKVTVRTTFVALERVNPVSQIFREEMEFEVVENGTRKVYRQRHLSRMVFPQELRALVELAGSFEFVEWFYGFKLRQRLDLATHPLMMIVVLRRKGARG